MKKICSVLLIAAIGIGFASCSKSSSAPSNSARVMFVNGCISTPSLDGSINGTEVATAANLTFLKNSGYQYVKAGSSIASFVITDGQAPIGVVASQDLTANASYSVFAGSIITHPTVLVTPDDLSAPAAGFAKVRLVNLASDTLNIRGYVGTQQIAGGIANSSASGFMLVTPGTFSISVDDSTKGFTNASLASQTISSGKIYTVIYTGTAAGTGTSKLTATVINNN